MSESIVICPIKAGRIRGVQVQPPGMHLHINIDAKKKTQEENRVGSGLFWIWIIYVEEHFKGEFLCTSSILTLSIMGCILPRN